MKSFFALALLFLQTYADRAIFSGSCPKPMDPNDILNFLESPKLEEALKTLSPKDMKESIYSVDQALGYISKHPSLFSCPTLKKMDLGRLTGIASKIQEQASNSSVLMASFIDELHKYPEDGIFSVLSLDQDMVDSVIEYSSKRTSVVLRKRARPNRNNQLVRARNRQYLTKIFSAFFVSLFVTLTGSAITTAFAYSYVELLEEENKLIALILAAATGFSTLLSLFGIRNLLVPYLPDVREVQDDDIESS